MVRIGQNLILGSVYEINGEGGLEVPGFVPTQYELLQLDKYYGVESVQVAFDEFIGAMPSSSELRIAAFSNRRLGRIAALLGREKVDDAYAEAEKEFRKSRSIEDDSRTWKIFKSGTKEERRAFYKEIHGEDDWLGILLDTEDDENSKE